MKIAVCFKIVREESEIVVNADRTLNADKASCVVSPYDCNAIEAAMKVAEAAGDSTVVAVTVGSMVENTKMRKAALSRGPAELYAVKADDLDSADSFVVANTLKSAIEKIGGVDLVICGEGSGDMYRQQTGCVLGALMGLPTVNAVSAITPLDGKLRVERSADDGTEVLEVALPAVLSVTSDIFPTKIPSMRDIMGAGKKPTTCDALADVCADTEAKISSVSVLAPEDTARAQKIVNGDSDEAVREFFEMIQKSMK